MHKQNNKWFLIVIISVITFITIVIYLNLYIYNTHTTRLKKEMIDELSSISKLRNSRIFELQALTKRYVQFLIKVPNFDELVYNLYEKEKNLQQFKDLNRTLSIFYNHGFINGVILIDTNKNIILKSKSSNSIIPSFEIKGFDESTNKEIENQKKIFYQKLSSKTKNINYSNLGNTDYQILGDRVFYHIVSPLVIEKENSHELKGFYIFSVNLKLYSPILSSYHSGEKVYTCELIKTDEYKQGKVVRIKVNDANRMKVIKNKSNIPIFYLPQQILKKGVYEGLDNDNERVIANISYSGYTDYYLVHKINLEDYYSYSKVFALYLIGFTFIIIFAGISLIYISRKYFRTLNYKREFELLLQRQAIQVRYETLLKNANDSIVLYDSTGKIFEFNDRFSFVFGLDNAGETINNISQIWVKEQFENCKSILLNTELEEGEVFESYNINRHEKEFPVEVSISSVKVENVVYNQAIIRDISERKNNEIALTESKEKYKNLVENINDVIFTIDTNGIIQFVSPVIINIIGYNSDEMINHSIFEFVSENEKFKPLRIREKLLNEEKSTTVFSLVKKSGDTCYVKVSTRLNKLPNNNTLITGVLTDITYEKELELMLEKERVDLKTIIDLSPVAIYFKDRYNNYIKVNKAAALISNSRVEEIEGKSARDIFPDKHDIYFKEDLEIITSGMPKFGIVDKLENNGNVIWLRSDKVPWYNEKGEVAGVICFSVDITEQVWAEDQLVKEKELLQWILKTIPVGVIYINKLGEIILGNKASESIFDINFNSTEKYKFNSDELKFYELDGTILVDENNPLNVFSSKSFETINKELVFYNKFNRKIILSINISNINDKTGNIEGIVASIEDITKRKEYEKALIESEKRYRTLFESMQEGFGLHEVIYNEKGKPIDYKFLEVNPSFERLTGLNSKEIIGKTAKQILPKLEDYWIEQYGKVSLEACFVEFESYSQDLDKYFRISAFSIVKGIFAVLFEDITEKKRIEKELDQHRQNLEIMVKVRTQELNKSNIMLNQEIEKGKGTEMMLKKTLDEVQKFSDMKTRFISTASHEFRTPLTTISSSIQLLGKYGKRWDDGKYIQHIERILRTIDNLTDLINDVLLVSKVESGKIECNPTNEDLNAFCLKLIDELKNDYAKNHILDYNYNSVRKEFNIDIKLLRSILTNLLTNAIKYSSVGEVIKIIVESNEGSIKFLIIDNGIGISEEDLSHLFEPFHRGKNVAEINGTGLGMSIIKRYIEIHGGTIEVKSELNKGTIVKLNIPIILQKEIKNESISN